MKPSSWETRPRTQLNLHHKTTWLASLVNGIGRARIAMTMCSPRSFANCFRRSRQRTVRRYSAAGSERRQECEGLARYAAAGGSLVRKRRSQSREITPFDELAKCRNIVGAVHNRIQAELRDQVQARWPRNRERGENTSSWARRSARSNTPAAWLTSKGMTRAMMSGSQTSRSKTAAGKYGTIPARSPLMADEEQRVFGGDGSQAGSTRRCNGSSYSGFHRKAVVSGEILDEAGAYPN